LASNSFMSFQRN